MSVWSQRYNNDSHSEREMTKVPVEGTLQCQTCYEYVENGVYVPEAKVLTWKCSSGHVSLIEDINL